MFFHIFNHIFSVIIDIDNNGILDKNDFECLAVRNSIMELAGDWTEAKYQTNRKIMLDLWNEIADIADFNKVRIKMGRAITDGRRFYPPFAPIFISAIDS